MAVCICLKPTRKFLHCSWAVCDRYSTRKATPPWHTKYSLCTSTTYHLTICAPCARKHTLRPVLVLVKLCLSRSLKPRLQQAQSFTYKRFPMAPHWPSKTWPCSCLVICLSTSLRVEMRSSIFWAPLQGTLAVRQSTLCAAKKECVYS